MSRSVPFRRTVSDAVSWRQDQAQNATIYILREIGPTGFLLKEEGEVKKFKVYLGDPHTCTCQVYKKEKDLCKHICWVLLKKFRIPREDSESFQLGLVEREINALLRGRTQPDSRQKRNVAKAKIESGSANAVSNGKEVLPQREITQEDVCPICQDEFLATREPVTYCRFGCAKSIHIKCMKVWAEHQQSTGETTIKCPLCREDFGEIEFLQKEYRNSSLQKTQAERGVIHRGVVCFQCNQSPIAGRCYRCVECRDKFLCQECFSSNSHSQHEFQFRQKPNQRWRPAQRSSGGALPEAVLTDMQNRELQDEDYELLLQLDSNDANRTSTIPEEFHKDCIDRWLIHEHPTCPVDGTVVWNPLTANLASQERRKSKTNRPGINNHDEQPQNNQLDLSGLGVTGVSARTHDATPGRRRTGVIPGTDQGGSGGRVDGLSAEFQLMGLGFGSQQKASSSENGSKDGQLRQGKLRVTPSQRTGLFSASQVNSIPSNPSFPNGHFLIDSSTLAASQENTLAEDEIGAVAYANYGRENVLPMSQEPVSYIQMYG
ncbi:putative E3 ubiquitin-protein ligase Zswim2-like [Apostichopus japonicus]|uniref:Putative E3 ubiquitin-protein ligase Zswim2-like n=1 Tax=Stichopus japonicus TaxID=307972 RepID=A0A2G8KXC4_STIJA|nr:putative E3 ubiquitin-protein ligase Zswim2-like [Apostichopus japonicus]